MTATDTTEGEGSRDVGGRCAVCGHLLLTARDVVAVQGSRTGWMVVLITSCLTCHEVRALTARDWTPPRGGRVASCGCCGRPVVRPGRAP